MRMKPVTLILASCLGLSPFVTGQETSCPPVCAITLSHEHPDDAFREMLQGDLNVARRGERLEPISAVVESTTLEGLVQETARRGGYLVSRDRSGFVLYGGDPDRALGRVIVRHEVAHRDIGDLTQHLDAFDELDYFLVEDANTLILHGYVEDIRQAIGVLESVDHPTPNVTLELLVVEYFHGDSFEWAFNVVDGTRERVSDVSYNPGIGFLGGVYDAVAELSDSFRLNLTALIADSEARVITNPHLAVRSGAVGEIDFEEELHVVITNPTESFGTTRTLEELRAGVRLEVTPRAFGSANVQLTVDGEVAVFVPAPANQFAIDRQKINSQVMVPAGRTLVIGGLVKKVSSREESGVPLLRRLPLLGRLFQREDSADRYIETVLYITPWVGDSAPRVEQFRQRALDYDAFPDLGDDSTGR